MADSHPIVHGEEVPLFHRIQAWITQVTAGLLAEVAAYEGRPIEMGDRSMAIAA